MLTLAQSTTQSFLDGGWTYNLVKFIFAIAGLAITVFGFGAALMRLKKTKKAALAARDAAQETHNQVAGVMGLITVTKLVNQCHLLIELIRSGNIDGAAQRAIDLQEGICTAREAHGTSGLRPRPEWQLLVTRVGNIQIMLAKTTSTPEDSNTMLESCAEQASIIHQTLSEMAGMAANAPGVTHANT